MTGTSPLAERSADLAVAHARGLAHEPELGRAPRLDDAVGECERSQPGGPQGCAQLVRDGPEPLADAREHRQIGDAPAADEARLDAACARQRGDLRAAAVHDADARVARHARDRRDGVERGVAAQLDDDEAAHVEYSALNVTYSGESEEA